MPCLSCQLCSDCGGINNYISDSKLANYFKKAVQRCFTHVFLFLFSFSLSPVFVSQCLSLHLCLFVCLRVMLCCCCCCCCVSACGVVVVWCLWWSWRVLGVKCVSVVGGVGVCVCVCLVCGVCVVRHAEKNVEKPVCRSQHASVCRFKTSPCELATRPHAHRRYIESNHNENTPTIRQRTLINFQTVMQQGMPCIVISGHCLLVSGLGNLRACCLPQK